MNIKQKYQQLNEKEQKLAVVSAITVIILLFYWMVWSPLNTAVDKNKASLKTQQELYTWVKKNASRAIQLKQSGSANGTFNGSLAQAVNRTAGQFNITISRMQPQSEQLQVWVDQADFNSVLSWLQTMEKMGITILDADFAESDTQGQVKIRRLQLGK